jgi:hypothetical protein
LEGLVGTKVTVTANFRITVQYELSRGYRMSYLADTFFPEILPEQRLIA